jgi:hypothetical protein
MDIVNWDAIKKDLLIRNTLDSPDDLVLVAANTTYKKRGDLFQTYAVPASVFAGGGGGGVSLVNTAGLISGGPISTTGTITTRITANNRLVGRYTAGAGVMEEISLGAGLTLSAGGVLSAATGPVTSVSLETNNVVNADQTLLDLTSGTGVNVAYSGAGVVTFSTTDGIKLSTAKTADQTFPIEPVTSTWRDVTGLSFSVVNGRTYMFTFNIFYSFATVNPQFYGCAWGINGTNTFSALNGNSEWPASVNNTNATAGWTTYDGGLFVGTTVILAARPVALATITGTITASSDGVVTARAFMESGGTLVVQKGSFVEYTSFL